MKVIGYQTLEDRGNQQFVEKEGPFRCVRHNAWLGQGYYFWDTEIRWAHDWGRVYNNQYLIGKSLLDLTNCYDLVGNMQHLQDFRNLYYELISSGIVRDKKTMLVPVVIDFLKELNRFSYSSIRAEDYPQNVDMVQYRSGREYMYLNKRSQICVIDKDNVCLSSFEVVYPEQRNQS